MKRQGLTPVGAVTQGVIAGAVGTFAMDVLLFVHHLRAGGKARFVDWEFSTGFNGWKDAPAPAIVGKRLAEGFLQRELPDDRAQLVNNVTHWLTGLVAGAQLGLLAGSFRTFRVRYGMPFGAAVWGTGYVVLPIAGVYQPIWEYDAKTLTRDLTAHLAYGLVTAVAFDALERV
jgi:hypothetical protein